LVVLNVTIFIVLHVFFTIKLVIIDLHRKTKRKDRMLNNMSLKIQYTQLH